MEVLRMEKSAERLKVLQKIAELEKTKQWDKDVEDDPETIELLPNKVDYLNKKLSSKIATFFANKAGTSFFEKLIKNNQYNKKVSRTYLIKYVLKRLLLIS